MKFCIFSVFLLQKNYCIWRKRCDETERRLWTSLGKFPTDGGQRREASLWKKYLWLFKSKFYYKFQPHRLHLKNFPARFGREKLCVTHCLHHSVESFLSQAQLRVSHQTLRRPFVARPDPFWPISLTKCQCQKALKKVYMVHINQISF